MRLFLCLIFLFCFVSYGHADLSEYVRSVMENAPKKDEMVLHLDFSSRRTGDFVPLGKEGLQEILNYRDILHSLESLLLDGNQLGADECHLFFDSIAPQTLKLKKLDLSNNPIGVEGVLPLTHNFEHWKKIEVLILNHAMLHSMEVYNLFKELPKLQNLRVLDVSANARLHYMDMNSLGRYIVQCPSLERLMMANLGLDDIHIQSFFKGIQDGLVSETDQLWKAPLKFLDLGDRFSNLTTLTSFVNLWPCGKKIDLYYRSNFVAVYRDTKGIQIQKLNRVGADAIFGDCLKARL